MGGVRALYTIYEGAFMSKASLRLLWASIFFFAVSMSTCFFGVRYAINQIPPEKLSRMGDTDWIGVEWMMGGGILRVIAILLALVLQYDGFLEVLWGHLSMIGFVIKCT